MKLRVLLALSCTAASALLASPSARVPHLAARVAVRALQQTEGEQLMEVQVPAGMAAGMSLRVSTPAGLMEVQIPEGVAAGQSFQMRVPAAPTPAPADPGFAYEPPPPPEADGALLGGMISRGDNPYVTSKADRMRAKFGDASVDGRSARSGGREQIEDRLADDLARFKSDAGLAGRTLAGGDRWCDALRTQIRPKIQIIIS